MWLLLKVVGLEIACGKRVERVRVSGMDCWAPPLLGNNRGETLAKKTKKVWTMYQMGFKSEGRGQGSDKPKLINELTGSHKPVRIICPGGAAVAPSNRRAITGC